MNKYHRLFQMEEALDRAGLLKVMNEPDLVRARIIGLSEELNEVEWDLALTLISRFHVRTSDQRNAEIIKSVTTAINQRCGRGSLVYLTPPWDPKDPSKINSGHEILGAIRRIVNHKFNHRVSIKLAMNCNSLPPDFCNSTLIVIVDDFIGTGRTTLKSFRAHIEPVCKIHQIQACCAVACAMDVGVNYLSREQVPVFTQSVLKKAISQTSPPPDVPLQLNIMNEIESRLSIRVFYKLGYSKSEACVAIPKVPNNCFPMFWIQKKRAERGRKSLPWPALLPRDT